MLLQPTECIDRLQLFATRSQLYCERESATAILAYSPDRQAWFVVRYSRGHLATALYRGMALFTDNRYNYALLTEEQLVKICEQISNMKNL